MQREVKANKIRTCEFCGESETIEVFRLMTIDHVKVRCKVTECDNCGHIFEVQKAK